MTKARTLADMISDGVIGTTELADDVITPVKLDETGSYSMAQLGIGTSSPSHLIDGRLSGTSSGEVISVGNATSGSFGGIAISDGGTYPVRHWGPSLEFYTGNSTYSSASEAMRIDSSGNVGIGTTSPTINLHVAGGAGGIRYAASSGASTLLYSDTNAGYLGTENNFPVIIQQNNTERMRIDSSGNVGIGTSSPSQKLEVSDTTSATVIFRVTNNDGNAEMQKHQDHLYLNLHDTGDIIFRSGSTITERMRIDSSGNLLVGTSNAAQFNTSTETGSQVSDGYIAVARPETVAYFNRLSTDGDIVSFRKNGTTVGSIGTNSSGLYIGTTEGSDSYLGFFSNAITPSSSTGAARDDAIDLGNSFRRFKDLYLSGGVYLGGTGSANKLDDYEYGDYAVTFTPSGGGSITVSGSQNDLKYTKIGSRVFISGKVDISAASSPSGYIAVTLPFVIHNSGTANDSRRFSGNIWVTGAAIETYKFQIYGIEGESSVRIYNGSGTSLASTAAEQFSGDEGIAFNFHYETTP